MSTTVADRGAITDKVALMAASPAHDPQLRSRDYDLHRIGQGLVGWARDRVNDAKPEARCLLGAELYSILGHDDGWQADKRQSKDRSSSARPWSETQSRQNRTHHRFPAGEPKSDYFAYCLFGAPA